MSLESVTGQPFAVDLCRKWLKRQTTHPLLFYGPPGAGKRALAIEVAKALNCQAPPSPVLRSPSPLSKERDVPPSPYSREKGMGVEGDSCDQCLSCRKVAAGNHPDVRM